MGRDCGSAEWINSADVIYYETFTSFRGQPLSLISKYCPLLCYGFCGLLGFTQKRWKGTEEGESIIPYKLN